MVKKNFLQFKYLSPKTFLDVFSIHSDNCALQPITIVWVLHNHLLPTPLQLQLVMKALLGLLTVESEAVNLSLHF